MALLSDDKVTISSVAQLKENTTVSIAGEVRIAGIYPFLENMSLKDLILQAGGFTDAAVPQRIEVARRIKSDNFNVSDTQVAEVLDVTSINDLDVKGSDIKLRSFDAVIVRKNPGYQNQVNVRVEGEVVYPGPYVLKKQKRKSKRCNKACRGSDTPGI